MALTVGRQGRGAREIYEPVGHPGQPADDYFVEGGAKSAGTPVWRRLIGVLEFILIVAIAVLSLAVFWMVGLIIGVF